MPHSFLKIQVTRTSKTQDFKSCAVIQAAFTQTGSHFTYQLRCPGNEPQKMRPKPATQTLKMPLKPPRKQQKALQPL